MIDKKLIDNEIKINIDSEVYDYGITHKQVCEFVGSLKIDSLRLNDYIITDIDGISIKLLPYLDIYDNIIISISID